MLEQLYESANHLVREDDNLAERLERKAAVCAQELTALLRERSDIHTLIGADNTYVMETNHENHYLYMASLPSVFDSRSFVEIVIWVLRTYRARGFSVDYWRVMLPASREILQRNLGQVDSAAIAPVYLWLEENLEAIAKASEQEHSFFEQLSILHGGGDGEG